MPTLRFGQFVQVCFITMLLSTGIVVTLGQTQLGDSATPATGTNDVSEVSDEVAPALPAENNDASTASDAPDDESVTTNLSREEYEGGWRQAGSQENGLGTTERQHILHLTPDGRARGRISLINPVTRELVPAGDSTLTFLDADGATAFEAEVGSNGIFDLQNVPEGVFSLVVTGPTAFMACQVQTLRVEDAAVETDWTFNGAAVPRGDLVAVLALLSMFDERDTRRVNLVEPAAEEIPEDALAQGGRRTLSSFDPTRLGTTIYHHPVYLQPDGRLMGRIRRIHPETGRPLTGAQLNVHAISDGEIVETATTDQLGTFAFLSLSSGVYSLIAEGADGFLACAIDVQPNRNLAGRYSDVIEVAMRIDEADTQFDASVVPSSNVEKVRELLSGTDDSQDTSSTETADAVPPADAGGPVANGATGGGGGAGVGSDGGLGDILGAALLATGVALLADDDDPRPASPATP